MKKLSSYVLNHAIAGSTDVITTATANERYGPTQLADSQPAATTEAKPTSAAMMITVHARITGAQQPS